MALGVPILVIERVFPVSIRLAAGRGINARQPEVHMVIPGQGTCGALQPLNSFLLVSRRNISQAEVIGRVGHFGIAGEGSQLPNRAGGVTSEKEEATQVVTGLMRRAGLLPQEFKFPERLVILAQSEETNC